MKVLLSSIGSRGDVQPLLALAIELRSLGHLPVLCVPPSGAGPSSRPKKPSKALLSNRLLWKLDERSWNRLFRSTINEERIALGLPPIETVPRHVSTDRPWLAADPLLGPAARTQDLEITQTGAWLLSGLAPLPDDLERFLADGAPPIYFGFGSMQASPERSRLLVQAARAVGRRAILSRGWAHLRPDDGGHDCFPVGDVNHERLFPRVAAVVHHGGAGTTATAARAGTPQLLIPHLYDQYYWAHRVARLGIGGPALRASRLTLEALISALQRSLEPQMAERARVVAPRIEPHGARIAAERLVREFG